MVDVSWCRVSSEVAAADARLVAAVEATLTGAAEWWQQHIRCRVGCTPCCIGPFDITVLDAARLLRGLAERPEVAAAVGRRARQAWDGMAPGFPGDATLGILADDDEARQAFFARFGDVPCPALDPGTGACDLYEHRPLSCRTFGLPVRYGEERLAPCELNFRAASPAELEAAAVTPDPADDEGHLLATVVAGGGPAGDTIVAAVLASTHGLENL